MRLHSRILWLLVLIGHIVFAGTWWWLMPGGFPVSHARFWVNQVLPLVVAVSTVAVLIAARRERTVFASALLIIFAAMWLAAGIAARVLFPLSLKFSFFVPILAAGVTALAVRLPTLSRAPLYFAAVGLLIGAWLPMTQRSSLASTHPLNVAFPSDPLDAVDNYASSISLRGFDVHANSAQLTIQRGRFVAYLQPTLTFESRSLDRCWTCFAPPQDRVGPTRMLRGFRAGVGEVLARYRDDDESFLRVIEAEGGAVEVESFTRLPKPVDSHLNTYCDLQFAGHRQLFVTFSPCPNAKIEVMNFEYPFGKPSRFAYVTADRTFCVVEATSGEKGPFKLLASGKLEASDELAITFHDGADKIARLTLRDFASQCSTALSPTAGWRVPVNAIEFSRDSDDPKSPASVFVTLAGTSVGRGFDSVGHAAGIYRNRLRFEWIDD